jgi:hypothetical protein
MRPPILSPAQGHKGLKWATLARSVVEMGLGPRNRLGHDVLSGILGAL